MTQLFGGYLEWQGGSIPATPHLQSNLFDADFGTTTQVFMNGR
jgi:hypothetical protein